MLLLVFFRFVSAGYVRRAGLMVLDFEAAAGNLYGGALKDLGANGGSQRTRIVAGGPARHVRRGILLWRLGRSDFGASLRASGSLLLASTHIRLGEE